MTQTATTVTQVSDQEVDAILGTGAASIMVPDEKKNKFFSNKIDTTFLDTPAINTPEGGDGGAAGGAGDGNDGGSGDRGAGAGTPAAVATPAGTPATPAATPASAANPDLNFLNPGAEEEEEEGDDEGDGDQPGAGTNGVPSKVSGLAKLTESFIKKGLIIPFEGEEDVSKYKVKDHEELWEMNLKKIKDDALTETQKAFFNSVSPQTRAILEYEMNGGTDLKSLFQALSASEQIQSLDISTEKGQEAVVRAHLQALQYGTPQEIEEEINSYKDRGDLEKKAKIAQPKLKSMQDAVVNQRLQHQANLAAQRQEQSRLYSESVYGIIEKANLKGLPLDPDTQGLLYHGLTEANYVAANGGQTTMLGHLLEKNQWVEPDHELIAEVLWLLADRESYHNRIKEAAKKETEGKVLRTLKDAAADKKGSTAEPEEAGAGTRKPLKREVPKRNLFARKV